MRQNVRMQTDMQGFRWGIFGTGAISAKFAVGLRHIGAKVTMVASRGPAGQAFADSVGATLVTGYAEAAERARELVDAVYIATPPAYHHVHALACIKAGVPVLIEKPFASNLADATQIAIAARSGNVFVMEAMWTRFMPALQRFRSLIETGAIGEPLLITGNFAQSCQPDPDHGNFDPQRGGGALAHLGYYPLALGQWLFGEVASAHAEGHIGATGVDESVAIALSYTSGVTAAFHTSLRVPSDNSLTVHGTHGQIILEGPIYRPWGVRVVPATPSIRQAAALSRKALFKEGHLWNQISQWRERHARRGRGEALPFSGNGYHYEALEVQRCVRAGLGESPVMPLDHSLALTGLLEYLRRQLHEGSKP